MDVGTPMGLAFSSGINAYLPLLSFAIAARWFHLYKVNPNFGFITQDWFLIALVILALADLLVDKIPIADHIWDAVHTVIRPIAGALVAAASTSQVPGVGLALPSVVGGVQLSSVGLLVPLAAGAGLAGAGLLVPLIVGAALAGMTHATKVVIRLASTATTAGCANTILSVVEDVVMAISVLISLLLPIVMVVVVLLFVVAFLLSAPSIARLFRWRRRVRGSV
ncbi:MAG TPA: DUF4126 domain-containing protein [Ktedonosporobacter sp.]|nr:DUF4126 domain-containing protein [Ktedonosporobacter sp.]